MSAYLRRHLTFANVVALVALAVSVGGTAYAADTLARNSVGTDQLKANSVTTTKVKNRSLRAVDFKAGELPQGAKGDTGTPGTKGADGAKGDTGPAGPLLEVLPAGATLRGVYAASDIADSADHVIRDGVSFPLTVPVMTTTEIVEDGGPSTGNCPGTVDEPEAVSGFLCIYVGFSLNADLVIDAPDGSIANGFVAQIASIDPGDMQSRGTWAVTR